MWPCYVRELKAKLPPLSGRERNTNNKYFRIFLMLIVQQQPALRHRPFMIAAYQSHCGGGRTCIFPERRWRFAYGSRWQSLTPVNGRVAWALIALMPQYLFLSVCGMDDEKASDTSCAAVAGRVCPVPMMTS